MSEDEFQTVPQGCGGNAAPYVLGALTEAEHDAFVRHMESCAVCREEVAALQAVAANLPATAPQVSAPPELKRRVMAEVNEDVRSRRAGERAEAPRRARRGAPAWRPAFAGAAVVAIVALLAVTLASGGGGSTRVIRAEVTPARASALLRLSGGHAELDVAGMPQSAPNRVYQVWLKGTGAPEATDALFTVTSGGRASVNVPGDLHGVRLVMVTAEPLGGSREPTSSPVIVARVS